MGVWAWADNVTPSSRAATGRARKRAMEGVKSATIVRWKDTNEAGNDALLAVDDFSLSTGTTTLATQNKALENALSVFPNPATNRLTLRMGKEGVGASVEIYNALGQRVQQAQATREDLTLDVSALRAGVYTIRFTTNGGTATRSFLKQ